MWAIYYTPAGAPTLERVKVAADTFNEAMDKARALIPSESRIIDCEQVGVRHG